MFRTARESMGDRMKKTLYLGATGIRRQRQLSTRVRGAMVEVESKGAHTGKEPGIQREH